MTLKVFYDARQSVANNDSVSPSAGKPALVVEEWKKKGYDFALAPVEPVTRADFYLAHHQDYIDGVLDLKRGNGFSNKNPDVAAALPWTTGSLLCATREALKTRQNTMSPTSGFHHAHWSKAEGFCTFNGLMVTAMRLHGDGLIDKIGILDIDHHYGNGTDDIIRRSKAGYIHHYTFGRDDTNYYWGGGEKAVAWLKSLPGIVETFQGCDVVIYQAGADPHVSDPFGGALTDEQLRERDRIVFDVLSTLKIPCAWNLAGGYQTPIQKVLDIHNATIEECLKVM